MNLYKKKSNSILASTIIKNLKKRNMEGYFFEHSKEAVEFIMSRIEKNAKVAYGGSMTFKDTGMLTALRNNNKIHLIDRDLAESKEEKHKMQLASFDSDYYFMSTNALTINGELINIDASGNRVASLIFGPKNVMILAGMNKVESSLKEAIKRVQNFATPPNALRLNFNTSCSKTGACMDCHNDSTLCCQIVHTRHSFIKGRIKVFLINEELGF